MMSPRKNAAAAALVLATVPLASFASTTGVTGSLSPAPVSTLQPSLALNYIIRTHVATPADNYLLGEVSLFAGNYAPAGWELASGQLLSISQNNDLYTTIGTIYGGDGVNAFAIPDLRGRSVVGTGGSLGLALGQTAGAESVTLSAGNLPLHNHALPQGGSTTFAGSSLSFSNVQPVLALNAMISMQGIFPGYAGPYSGDQPYYADLRLTARPAAPNGWALAQGQILAIQQNQPLFALLGTNFGGNGYSTFALPNLSGRAPIGVGAAPGLTPQSLGQSTGAASTTLNAANLPPHLHTLGADGGGTLTGATGSDFPVETMQPTLAFKYIIATQGIYPARNDSGSLVDSFPLIGQVSLWPLGYGEPPSGWLFADGSTLPISQYTPLFSILGTTYGGNGYSTFTLPDLRDRLPIGAGQAPGLSDYLPGQTLGSESISLTLSQLPAHTHDYTPVPEPTTASLTILGLAVPFLRRRRQA